MSGRSVTWLRCCLVIFAVISALCVSGPALYFKFRKGWKLKGVSASCTPCSCHCAHPQSLLQIVPGLANLTVTDCGKDDTDLKEEMEKQFVDLLSEELRLQETVGKEHSQHMNITLREASWHPNTKGKLRNAMLLQKLARELENELRRCS